MRARLADGAGAAACERRRDAVRAAAPELYADLVGDPFVRKDGDESGDEAAPDAIEDDVSPRTPTTISPPGMTASCILPSTDGVWNAEVDARDTSFATDPAGSPRLPSAATRVRTTTTLGSRPYVAAAADTTDAGMDRASVATTWAAMVHACGDVRAGRRA